MIDNLMYMIVLLIAGFVISRVILQLFRQVDAEQYRFSQDIWLYMSAILAIGTVLILNFAPDFNDYIVTLKLSRLLIWFGLSLFIYIIYLFEIDKLLAAAVCISSVAAAFQMPTDFLVFDGLLPFWADRLSVAAIICILCYGAVLLNAFDGIFGLQMSMAYCGIAAIACLGGLPIILGLLAAFAAGVWFGYLHLNWYPSKIFINNGASISATFLLCCFLLQGTIELAGTSMIILTMYIWAELSVTFANRYFFRAKEANVYENTGYWTVYNEGVPPRALLMGLFKIFLLNVILSMFQLYSPNAFSLPIFVLVTNLWLINVMFRATNGKLTLKQANQEFIKNFKEQFFSNNDSDEDNKS